MKRAADRQPAPAIDEAELAVIAPELFARPALWSGLALPPGARDEAGGAPWGAYWAVRLGPLTDPAADRAVLARAHAAFAARGERLGAVLACAAAIESFYYDETPLEPLDAWIEWLDAALADDETLGPNAETAAEIMACGSGVLLRQPNHRRLGPWSSRGRTDVLHMAPGPSRTKLASFVVQYHLWRGESSACKVVVDALPGIDLAQLRAVEALTWLQGLAAHARNTADFERGQAAVRDALELVERHRLPRTRGYVVHAHGAPLALAAGDVDGAARHLDAMRESLADQPLEDQTHYWHGCVGLALLRGDANAAVALARSVIEQSGAIGGPYRAAAHRLSLASALWAAGETAACLSEARLALDAAQTIEAQLLRFSASLLVSAALDRLGDPEAGDAQLAHALDIGAAQDYATTSAWWMPGMVAARLARALRLGVHSQYVQRFVQRAGLRCPDRTLEAWPWPLVLRGFGEFSVSLRGEPLGGRGERIARRPLDLLRALLAHGGGSIPVNTALDWLWPDTERDAQRKAFDAALGRLRKTLGDDGLLVLDGGQLLLDRTRCWSDVAALAEIDWTPAPGADAAALTALAERLLRLVRGPLLDGMDALWAGAARERVRRRFVFALAAIADRLEAGAPDAACRLYERALQADPLAESLARRLIRTQLARGERAEALRAWHHCKAMLALHGTAPSSETLALVRDATLVR